MYKVVVIAWTRIYCDCGTVVVVTKTGPVLVIREGVLKNILSLC